MNLYYEEQKKEAKRRAADFIDSRLPKFLDYFEQVLAQNPRGSRFLVGARLSYADLSMFQVVEGLRYAFPRAMARQEEGWPRLLEPARAGGERPRIAAYLASKRRLPFSDEGIFRHYPAALCDGRDASACIDPRPGIRHKVVRLI